MRVLVVDDHVANRKGLHSALEAEGVETFDAADGVEALAVLDRNVVDAIISDILMPRMDGYRLCLEVRHHKKFNALPFIVYTSTYTSPDDERAALGFGADKFLKRPASVTDILMALREVTRQGTRRQPNLAPPQGESMKEYNEALVRKLEQKNSELEERTRELHATHQQLRALAAGLQAAREEERVRIARELHDELGAVLTRLKLSLAYMRNCAENESVQDLKGELLAKIAELGGLADGAAERVRAICTELRPPLLHDVGLAPAIEWQISEFEQRTKIRCEAELQVRDLVIPDEPATALFRILQEMLTNVTRHSHASRICVRLKQSGANLLLEVKDNGRGIEMNQLLGQKSLGLIGMRERAALFGGELQVRGQPGKGTAVTATIPLVNLCNRNSSSPYVIKRQREEQRSGPGRTASDTDR